MFKFSAVSAQIKYKKREDLGIIYSNDPFYCTGVFTKNKVKAAPVIYSQNMLKKYKLFKALIVNSGNANACTGKDGLEDCFLIEDKIRKIFKIDKQFGILQASTGVIGVKLPVERIISKLDKLKENLDEKNLEIFARAIMTTDTFPKITKYQSNEFKIIGVAKGAGMIHPNMATMLSFIMTNADLPITLIDSIFKNIVNKTFNSISVDGDTSTNDSVFLLIKPEVKVSKSRFKSSLFEICHNLSKMIVKDGEGSTKLIKIIVKNAPSTNAAKTICEKIATSPLVKTAFFGNDPNWGRILCAIGNSNIEVDPEKIELYFGDFKVVENGKEYSKFNENEVQNYLRENREVGITVDLNLGNKRWEYYTCDFSYDYVRINAEYRT